MADELICRVRGALGARWPAGFKLDAELRILLREAPVTVLFGPSGAGKTTLLRVLAGLERADKGEISFAGRTWFDSARGIDLAPQKRRAGFLFQDYALFPHLTVRGNVEFAARRETADRLLKAFGLAEVADRMPRAISGGQQQRAALARALAADPELLLLDEPLSALDAQTRAHMRHELRRALIEGGVPAVVVTHDRTEAVALGDWMAVMIEGRIRQVGPVQEVFRRPADAQVAQSAGVENVLPVEMAEHKGGLLTLRVGGTQLECVDSAELPASGGAVFACIRAEDVALSRDPIQGSSIRNRLPGLVRAVTIERPLARIELDCGFPLVAMVTAQSAADLGLKPGDAVCAVVKATAVHVTE